jgi:3-dehydroquinate synthase
VFVRWEPQVLNVDAPLSVSFIHRLRVTRDAFDPDNRTLIDVLAPAGAPRCHAVAFVDQGLADANPDVTARMRRFVSAHAARLDLAAIHTVPGGEACKNAPDLLERVLRQIHDARICRQSYVIAIGGGAVLDIVGYAAAITHRGVRLVRLPSTTLAQCDSGVGVKNGVNAFGKKNFLGTFAPPWAVINDTALLETLSDRDWRAGFSEIAKVGLVKDRALFDRLAADAGRIVARDAQAALPVMERSAVLHLQHIAGGGDPFETTTARPLDFGHWAAHKLEQLTGFEVRHGEAVAVGIALDTAYSALSGFLAEADAAAVFTCLRRLGLPLHHAALADDAALLAGLEEFREHLGGPLTITLLRGLGDGFDVHQLDRGRIMAARERLAEYAGAAAPA